MAARQSLENPCPHCGSYAHLPTPTAGSVCVECGQAVPPLAQPHVSPAHLSSTPLHIGMKAMIGGQEYTAVGRLVYTEESRVDASQWEEWVLLTPQGDEQYLEYDSGRWTLFTPFEPLNAPTEDTILGVREGSHVSVDGVSAVVVEAAPCRITGYEGCIPWTLQPREPSRYADLTAGQTVYSVETGLRGDPQWFRGRRVPAQEVFTLFGRHDLVQETDRRQETGRDRTRFGLVCLLAGLIALALWGIASQPGQVVAQGSLPVASLTAQGTRLGPFPLSRPGRVYRMRVTNDLTDEGGWVQGSLESAQSGAILDVSSPGPIVPLSGAAATMPPSDGAVSYFQLTRAGYFHVRLSATPEPAASTDHAGFIIEQGVLYPPYLAAYAGVAFVFGTLFIVAGWAANRAG